MHEREVTIMPGSATVKEADRTNNPAKFIKEKLKVFLPVYRKGLSLDDIHLDMDFDSALDLIDPCVVLHKLDVPEERSSASARARDSVTTTSATTHSLFQS